MQPSNYKELWKEICFILRPSVNDDERFYELKVLQAVEKLGWSHFKKEIGKQHKVQIGNNKFIKPDLVIFGQNNKALAVIEIKRPAEDIEKDSTIGQLRSYMRQMKAAFGLLIGNKIHVYYDGNRNTYNEPISVLKVSIQEEQKAGERFVEMFSKANFLEGKHDSYVADAINKIKKNKNVAILIRELISKDTQEGIYDFISGKFAEFGEEVIKEALSQVTIEVKRQEPTRTGTEGKRKTPPRSTNPNTRIADNIRTMPQGEIHIYRVRNAEARMIVSKGAYILLKGSTAVIKENASMPASSKKRKDELIESGELALNDNRDLYEFTANVSCKTPSLASGIISGSSTNGRKEFKLPR